MKLVDFAKLFNGREYMNEITQNEQVLLKNHNYVMVFGYSDDNMEFRGAIHAGISAYDGTTAYLTSDGLVVNKCDCDNCPYHEDAKKNAKTIDAFFDLGEYSWVYNTAIPHETFEILEDSEPYCLGIIFALDSV